MKRIAGDTRLKPRQSIAWENNCVLYIDQRLLPGEFRIIETDDWRMLTRAIKTLAVRGAPLIGITTAYAVALAALSSKRESGLKRRLRRVTAALAVSRPTAVNLIWALKRMHGVIESTLNLRDLPDKLVAEAAAIHREDAENCRKIGEYGQEFIQDGARILTICNTGFLATGGEGTAAAVIYKAHDNGKDVQVFACETRPLLQGSRLTAWEMQHAGIPVKMLVDSAAASLVSSGKIDLCIIGADRIAANGDTVNKIGSLQLAVLCSYYRVPFYVAAPGSTIDRSCENGSVVPIEHRSGDEVTRYRSHALAPKGTLVYNPAFDMVPANLISAIITEDGSYFHPYAFDCT